jgi:hypothetical protein
MALAAKGPPRRGSADGPIDAVCLFSSSAADAQTNSPPRPDPQEEFSRLRRQRLVERLHRLGPKPRFHFLNEVELGADLWPHLERYAVLPPTSSRPTAAINSGYSCTSSMVASHDRADARWRPLMARPQLRSFSSETAHEGPAWRACAARLP